MSTTEISRDEIRQQLAALTQEARDNWHDPVWRRVMAAEMTETIEEGFLHENLIEIMSDTDVVGEFDRVFVKEIRGLRAFYTARGSDIEASTISGETMEVPRENLGFRLDEFEDKMRSNFAEAQANIVDLGIQRMQATLNQRFLTLLQTGVPSGHDSYISDAGLSLTSLNTAIREVRDESRADRVVIVGRSTMIDQIYDEVADGAGFFPESNEEYLRRGSLGVYRGASLVPLTNYKDDQEVPFFPANELYVIGQDASKVAVFGGLKSKEWTDEDWYWHYQTRQEVGMVLHRPERLRRIVDSNQSA